ncbi:MAG TPA: YqhA family protein [Aquella sp.]|nr:YqhA family protein [Aquella sp.]
MDNEKQDITELVILGVRLLLLPFYLGLIACLILYCIKFLTSVYTLLTTFMQLNSEKLMMEVLSLLDSTMVAMLLVLVIIGSYTSFVSERIVNKRIPSWLTEMKFGALKIKFSGVIVGVSVLGLAGNFMDAETLPWSLIGKRVLLHLVFLASAFALAKIEKITH